MSNLNYDLNLKVEKPYRGDRNGSFVLNADFLEMVLLKADQADQLNGCVWFGSRTAGPPSHVHGGCQAAVLDEMMGSTAWHLGLPVVAAHINVEFLTMIPVRAQYHLKGRILSKENRKIRIQAEIFSDETVYARSEGLFIILSDEQRMRLRDFFDLSCQKGE